MCEVLDSKVGEGDQGRGQEEDMSRAEEATGLADLNLSAVCSAQKSETPAKSIASVFDVEDEVDSAMCQSPETHPNCDTDCRLQCPAGTYYSSGGCWECQPGFYCVGGSAAPQKCPTGTANAEAGESGIQACKECPLGFLSLESGWACRPCPPGYECDPVSGHLRPCSPGQYSHEGEHHCSPCPNGFVCPDGREWKLCPPGQQPDQDNSRCIDCPPGFFSTWTSPRCLPCSPGSYCPFAGKIQTVMSPTGFLKDGSGQISSCICNNCPGAPDIEDLQRSSGMPITCQPGYYVAAGECKLCPPGHYCSDGSVSTACPAGTFSEKEGLSQQSECTLCPAGFYCSEGRAQPPGPESLCPAGFYCPIGTRSSHAYPCPAGTYNQREGQGHRGSCQVCSEGLFCQEGSSASGFPCSRGKFCPAGISREQDCPPGSFTHHSGASRIEECVLCPAGYYCLSNTSYPIPCPAGTFNALEGQDEAGDCIPCSAGRACTHPGLTQPDTDCSPGYVCPVGSRSPAASESACLAGTFGDGHDLFDKSQCDMCPARFFCPTGSGGRQRPPVPCPRGHYCPPGTKHGSQYKCPPGTWSDRASLASDRECYPCPAGWFCLMGAESPSGKCSAGYFCPEGSQFGSQFPCPAGTYNLKLGSVRVGECNACPTGSYCPAGTSKPSLCPLGTYRAEQGAREVGECDLCPAGSSCPDIGMGAPVPCRAGNFSDKGSSTCLPCLAGRYCHEDRTSRERMMQLVCPAGRVCPSGMSIFPDEESSICPEGHYCPEGSNEPRPCPNGTYGHQPGMEGLEECLQCPEGHYCYQEGQEGIPGPTGLCPQGYRCPPGTGFPLSYPCQPGSYWNMTKTTLEIPSCLPCPAGFFCDLPSLLVPKICPAGFHCHPGSSQPEPCPEGTYNPNEGLFGEAACRVCEAGRFCAGVGLSASSGQCQEGFYCPEGSTSPFPSRDVCPAGSYCPAGSGWPTMCPPGTYSNQTGLARLSQCLTCPPGMFCDGQVGSAPAGNCSAGYYCTEGSHSPVQHEVPPGFFSQSGAFRPEPCPPGTFQPLSGQSSCRACPLGNFCNSSNLSDVNACPQGHYCPLGSTLAMPCPAGTFSNSVGNAAVDFCEPCSSGMFCSRPGLSQPEGYCEPGYYCTRGTNTSHPVGLQFGDICPAGHYCYKGMKEACPIGTWNSRRGSVNGSWCLSCPPGLYCDVPGLAEPAGICHKGYFCLLGSASPRPQDGVTGDMCPAKHFCPAGASEPIPCPEGTYSNSSGQSVCRVCPMGHTCAGGDILQCPAGHYCPEEVDAAPIPCPPGTFNPKPGVTRPEGCRPCLPGSMVPNPTGNWNVTLGGPCPVGHFCPAGTSLPVPCPPGTFSGLLFLTAESLCTPCPPGYYCSSPGQSAPTHRCLAGYYCTSGVSSSAPSNEAFPGEGGACPGGHYCPAGSSHPLACPSGTYNPLTHQQDCLACPAGYYCAENTTDYSLFQCPAGFYCPRGTKHGAQFPCPRGYYNPDPGTHSLDSCLPCTPGHYCGLEGLGAVSGQCDAGWFCVSAAWTPQPFDLDNYTSANCLCPATSTGGKCLPGFYCPRGTTEPIACPPGSYCQEAGLASPSGDCAAGYFCSGGATLQEPTDAVQGNICPPGTFCSNGSHHPQPCPSGTFSADYGLGYYCPEGQIMPERYPCPIGHHCLRGSAKPAPCLSGYHQNEEKQGSCRLCKAGYYCELREQPISDYSQFVCPQGHFCPTGTQSSTQYSCPPGTYGPRWGAANMTACARCPPGKYCERAGLAQPSGDCSAGCWCNGEALEECPQDGLSGGTCPRGHYCTQGTHSPMPCPAGTWSDKEGCSSRVDCQPCPGGQYCNISGLTSPSGICAAGYYCAGGSESSAPSNGPSGGLCPPGHYCPPGSASPILCPPGTYVSQSGATECGICPAGKYCVPGMSPNLCPRGFYCPQGTGLDWKACPPGTYSSELGLETAAGCRLCDAGKYCMFSNATSASGDCAAGYFCATGSRLPNPELETPGSAGPCPPGHYCAQASAVPTPCPQGTFSLKTKLHSESGATECGICPAGKYCVPGMSPNLCPRGFYCPQGTGLDWKACPPGTYSSELGLETAAGCRLCDAGKYCMFSNATSASGDCAAGYFCATGSRLPNPELETPGSAGPCPPGHYCAQASAVPTPCPQGTFSLKTKLHSEMECTPCPAGQYCGSPGLQTPSGQCNEGFYCVSASVSPEPLLAGPTGGPCPTGHFCPSGSATPQPCPPGTYSPEERQAACRTCKEGFICPKNTSSLEGKECSPGFYCPAGTASSRQFPCPRGTYNPQRGSQHAEDCLPCDPGHYCDAAGQTQVTGACSEGFYCVRSATSPTPNQGILGDICPLGHYCPSGCAAPHPCPTGFYSNTTGSSGVESCVLCDPGQFCDRPGLATPSGPCDEGYFCVRGSPSSHPFQVSSSGGPCPAGHVCPKGSHIPLPCPAGTYSQTLPRHGCYDCPEGFYCLAGSSNATICPKGFYCPKRTEYAAQNPCPVGTFSDVQGAADIGTCLPCPPGRFCSKPGLKRPEGSCAPGWFCPAASVADKPVLLAQSPGKYCGLSELFSPSGLCDAGFYCVGGSSVPNPDNSEMGGVCPPGHFCASGSSSPSPCPPGTSLHVSGARASEDCLPCPAGFYCSQWGSTDPDAECMEGWFCPQGTIYPQTPEHLCPVGHYCPKGSSEPLLCPMGYYQDKLGQSLCQICPAGKYCGLVTLAEQFPADAIENPYKPQDCPAGYYCVEGTVYGHQHPCPAGTYSNTSGLMSIEECSPCPGGWFCAQPGLSSPLGRCAPGYYCTLNAQSPEPFDGTSGNLCPVGYFCPAGSRHPLPCPAGSFQPRPGMSSPDSCLACPPGRFCRGEASSDISGNCSAGFYCVLGAAVESPVDGSTGSLCPKGHYCPSGTSYPLPCENGFYQDLERQSNCKICPEGFYCNITELAGSTDPEACPAGHFCPKGSYSGVMRKCPRGTYSPDKQLKEEVECRPCPAGFYCDSEGMLEPSGRCQPGYWCMGRAEISNPTDGVTGNLCPVGKFCASGDLTGDCLAGYFCDVQSQRADQSVCPPGFYCPVGTASPLPCDRGTYAPLSGGKSLDDCRPCPPGCFCNGTGKAMWEGLCSPGYFCPSGQISARPPDHRCPSGFFCPAGSPAPLPCESGTHQSLEGKEACNTCPKGFYCGPANDSSGISMPSLCPAGHFCPPGASFITVFPCPAGTYGPKTGASSKSDCEPCPAGMYCSSEALHKPTGYCHAGYYCSQGAVNPTPITPRVPYDLNSPQNDICPAGHYCPNGTRAPVPCPPGTFSMAAGLSTQDECHPCPAGHYCPQAGLSDPSMALPCSAGYVCREGSAVSCPSGDLTGYRCPAGFYCPVGSSVEIPCDPGTFSPMPGASACLPCPAGSSCMHVSTVEPLSCPRGNYCPTMTSAPIPCPAGTFNPVEGALSLASCKRCPAGRYCRGEANWEPDGLCSAGYYCAGEAADFIPQKTVRFPLNGPCPPGHYCPEGTPSLRPCPIGTLKNATGGSSLESCVPCYAGHFCASPGLSSPTGLCAAGFYCPGNFTSTSPTAFLCPKGHFCPPGSSHPTPCPTGQFQPNTGSHSCTPCQPGFYCQEAVAGHPHRCPPHSYCPAGALYPLPCPNGTFTPLDMSGLREKGECLPCPPGQYCRAGKLQGLCAAGHFCLSGSSEYTPHVQNISRSSPTECHWGQMCAGICPPGHYCQEGTVMPIPCPENTLRTSSGARSRDECTPCPPGSWCKEGSSSPVPCPAGHYCSGKSQSNGTNLELIGPQECPVHTYRTHPGAEKAEDCQPCPPGHYCKMPGVIMYEEYLCPPGHWCLGISDPLSCPAGTFRTEPGAASPEDCQPCPEGHYCPDPAATMEANIMGIPCRPGYECPSGSVRESVCRAGAYCPPRTGIPPLCPGGFVCPEGSSSYNTSTQLCTFPYYCPPGSAQVTSCSGGSRAVHVTSLRDSAETSCRKCDAGTYRSGSATDASCRPCPAGYSCPPGADSYLSHPCLVGHYCPSNAIMPVPCPPGTYCNNTQGREITDCHLCPSGTYNHLSAQVSCFVCGSSSHSKSGARSCVCRGRNRSFQESDGSCICLAGFVFFDNRQQQRSDSSSDQDCQPQVEERCSSGEVRLAATRKCVSPEQYDCTPTCGLLGGQLSPELGMCHCAQYVSAEELCDRFCLMKVPRISMSLGSNRQLLLQIEESEKRRSRKLEVLNVLGPDHVWGSERVHLVVFSPSGIFGVLLSSAQVIEAFLAGDSWSVPTPRKTREREQPSGSLPRIPSPILCLKQGDVVLFQLSVTPNDRTASHYPIYQKDHLYNSNPRWDFGAFRRLDHLIKETNINVSRFAHVFGEPGTYVFRDNGVGDRSLFLSVKERNVQCDPEASNIQPSSPYQLIRHGMVNQKKLHLAPNWTVILGVLLLLFIVMVVLLVVTVVLRPSLYSPSPLKSWKPRWRSLGEPYIPPEYVLTRDSLQFYGAVGCYGSGEMFDMRSKGMAHSSGQRSTRPVLEDFSVRTLFDKLEDQTLHLTSQLGRHRNETLSFYKAFIQRIQALKEMIQNLDVSSNKGLEWRNIAIDGEVESVRTNVTHQQSEGSTTSMIHDYNTDHIHGTFLQEAVALMKVLKKTLMKTRAELEVKKEKVEKQQQNSGPGEGFYTQSLQVMAALYREDNLRKLIAASPLTKTLEEIKEALQSHDKERKENVTMATTGDLIPMSIIHLSPRQLVVYRFGSAILHLVCHGCSQNPLLLLIAQAIPTLQSPVRAKEVLCLDNSYYDTENNVLFVPAKCLEHAGELAVSILHAVAQIKSGHCQSPVDSDYLHCINRGVQEICQAFIHCWGTDRTMMKDTSQADPDVTPMFEDLLSIHKLPEYLQRTQSLELLVVRIKGCYYDFRSESHARINLWRDIESSFSNTSYVKEKGEDHLDPSIAQEEALDDLNEEFLQLVTQALGNKEKKELNLRAEDVSLLSRAVARIDLGTSLEIRRRVLAERISRAESGLHYLQKAHAASSAPEERQPAM
ncbi:uncharacterized protein PAF06_016002 [Gastrophryne carolinensis]